MRSVKEGEGGRECEGGGRCEGGGECICMCALCTQLA